MFVANVLFPTRMLGLLVFGGFIAPGFLQALIPFAASAIGSLVQRRAQRRAQKQTNQQEQARSREAAEAQFNDPRAQAGRMAATLRLGRLLGAMGGRDKAPPSLIRHLEGLRGPREFVPRAKYASSQTPQAQPSLAAGLLQGALQAGSDAYAAYKAEQEGEAPRSQVPYYLERPK